MSSSFEIRVEISGQKFDVILEGLTTSLSFAQIFPKIRRVVKIGANEDLTITMHRFQIIEESNESYNQWFVKGFGDIIQNKSIVLVFPKTKDNRSSTANKLSTKKSLPQINRLFKISKELFEEEKQRKCVLKSIETLNKGLQLSGKTLLTTGPVTKRPVVITKRPVVVTKSAKKEKTIEIIELD